LDRRRRGSGGGGLNPFATPSSLRPRAGSAAVGLSIAALLAGYRSGARCPSDLAAAVCERIERDRSQQPVWITRVVPEQLLAAAHALDDGDRDLPLYGIPFAVKDNIDVAGLPTTAGCPGFAREAEQTAPVVQRLLDAGALLVGKTNMDQFATGLVGMRSPYGACWSVFDRTRVSGGSSSGSAVAVALGHVTFALGTDTAGSGRVPAAFNGLVGLKPTRGLLSTRGVVPACASLDCVSVLAAGAADAAAVLDVLAAPDPLDPWSRSAPTRTTRRLGRIGVPLPGQAEPDEPEAAAAWARARGHAAEEWRLVPLDISPLLEASPLLYAAWVAERTTDLAVTIDAEPEGLDPIVAEIIGSGARLSATDVFASTHRLAALCAAAAPLWAEVDALLLPTTPLHPTRDQVAADPVGVNEQLGRFVSFVNLMDLAALALPGPERRDGLPFGVTLMAPAYAEPTLLELGAEWMGESIAPAPARDAVTLAVAGAHMSGLPLNGQLTTRGARLLRADRTATSYRLYALPGEGVRRPGLVRVPTGGAGIEIELWELSHAALGALLSEVPSPLAIGRVQLADGSEVTGFVCEGHAAADAEDVTVHGGWRAYLAASAAEAAA
jgi:allophanate hydrolase